MIKNEREFFMLYPQRNKYPQYIDLSGYWDFRFDTDNEGLKENWQTGSDKSQPRTQILLLNAQTFIL